MATAGGRTFLEDLSLELTNVAALLAQYAERDAGRREAAAGERVTVRQVEGVLAARYARSAVFGLDLANPGTQVKSRSSKCPSGRTNAINMAL